jgi:hypothetical protein
MMTEMKPEREYIFKHLNQTLPLLMVVFLFFNPFPHTTAIKELCFYTSVAILLILIFYRKTNFSIHSPLSISFGLFTLWVFFGLFFALNKSNSIHDFYAHLLKYLVLYYLIINYFNSRKAFLSLVWTIVISSGIFSFWILVYYYIVRGNTFSTKLGLFMDQIPSNIVGVITLFGFIIALSGFSKDITLKKKSMLFFCAAITLLATLMTQSTGMMISLFVSLPFLFWNNKKAVAVFVLVLIVIVTSTPLKNKLYAPVLKDKIIGVSDDRLKIASLFIEMAKGYPIAGIGFGMQTYYDENLLKKYNEKVPDKFKQKSIIIKAPHNSLVDIAVRTGFIGLSLHLFILFVFIRMSWSTIRHGKDFFIRRWGSCLTAAFFAIFTQGMVENTLFGPPAIIQYTIFARMTILWKLHIQSDVRVPTT